MECLLYSQAKSLIDNRLAKNDAKMVFLDINQSSKC